ncbi:hypothetical protein [Mucilaginibacter psychrotolerans]|uniref:Uncharacterized protein n=1 Tax=Mucilaginibacter psychrotolerans TaxID=1524096 RepID=A0A4Y8S5S2_9SPHI|nr:hypothetical protein [Mucilaginibacter psychrotolerans]TFF34242.1 hypothetical protein E2R66_22925 [Mucilaginibacter psychrotolerans]
MDFKIIFLPVGYDIKDVNNDNTDINVVLPNNKVYFGTLFTQKNIQVLMEKDEQIFFWSTDMVIVKDLSKSTIHKAIQELFDTNYLTHAFSEIGNISEVFAMYKSFEAVPYIDLSIV